MIRSDARVFNWKSASQPTVSLWGLTAAAGSVALVCTLSGFGARFGWLFELTSHFRLQYALALFVPGILFALRRQLLPASIFLGGALINLVTIAPYLLPAAVAEGGGPPVLNLLLINVHSANSDATRILSLIERTQPDLILLEEITHEWVDRLGGLRTHYAQAACDPRDDNFGIALFSRIPLERAGIVYLGEAQVPSVEAEFVIAERRILFIGTHPVPPASPANLAFRNDQLEAAGQRVRNWNGPAILLGDLNTTPYSPYFHDLLRASQLRDTGRGFRPQGTWPVVFPPLRIPLDHCLVSRDFVVRDRRVGPRVGSDHLPLAVALSLAP